MASVSEHLMVHGPYGGRDHRIEVRLAELERAIARSSSVGQNAVLEADNARLRDRVIDLEETLVRTRAAAELVEQADAARSKTVELLSEAIRFNEHADRLRREAASQMEEALANFTRSSRVSNL